MLCQCMVSRQRHFVVCRTDQWYAFYIEHPALSYFHEQIGCWIRLRKRDFAKGCVMNCVYIQPMMHKGEMLMICMYVHES